MSAESDKKVKFIKAWYTLEAPKLSLEKRITLLKKWIASCTNFEEYEMAQFLAKEKVKLIKQLRINKIGKRSLLNRLILIIKIIKRKFK